MLTSFTKKCDVLLVEDNPGDVRLTVEVFKEGQVEHNVHVAENGLAALKFLKKEQGHEDAVTPDLILVDLNMPIMDGREFLREIKQDPTLKKIPVCILSTSSSETDVNDSYALHANSYITKPLQLNDYREVIRTIEKYWLGTVQRSVII
jgi:CheY-like chemotaxis protein